MADNDAVDAVPLLQPRSKFARGHTELRGINLLPVIDLCSLDSFLPECSALSDPAVAALLAAVRSCAQVGVLGVLLTGAAAPLMNHAVFEVKKVFNTLWTGVKVPGDPLALPQFAAQVANCDGYLMDLPLEAAKFQLSPNGDLVITDWIHLENQPEELRSLYTAVRPARLLANIFTGSVADNYRKLLEQRQAHHATTYLDYVVRLASHLADIVVLHDALSMLEDAASARPLLGLHLSAQWQETHSVTPTDRLSQSANVLIVDLLPADITGESLSSVVAKWQSLVAGTPVEFISKTRDPTASYRVLLRSLLNEHFRVVISDGRIIEGQLVCLDKDCNIILAHCDETDTSTGTTLQREMLVVPGKHIQTIERKIASKG